MLTYLYSDDDFPYLVPDERSVAHLNTLRAAAQSIRPVFHVVVPHQAMDEDLAPFAGEYEAFKSNFASPLTAAIENRYIASRDITSLHIHVYALLGSLTSYDESWADFWNAFSTVEEFVCYGSSPIPINMLPMLELLSNSPYGYDVLSDDEEDDVGPAPLGTSDLVIPDDREEAEETEEVDQLAGDDAPNEASELIAAVVAQLNESHAAAMEDTPFVPVEGMSYFDHCQRGLTTVLLTTYLFSRIHSYCLSGRSYVRRTRIVVPRGIRPGRWLRFYGGWFWFPSSHSNRGRCYELLRGSHTPF